MRPTCNSVLFLNVNVIPPRSSTLILSRRGCSRCDCTWGTTKAKKHNSDYGDNSYPEGFKASACFSVHFLLLGNSQTEQHCIATWPPDVTSAVTLRVFGEAADHRLHRLLQHRRVPRVTVAGGPEPRSNAAVQAVELQRGQRRGRPRGGGQRGRGGQQRRDGDRDAGPQGGAEGPGRSRTEADARLQPLRADAVRDHVGFHCPDVTSAKSRSGFDLWRSTPTVSGLKTKRTKWCLGVLAGFGLSQSEGALSRCSFHTHHRCASSLSGLDCGIVNHVMPSRTPRTLHTPHNRVVVVDGVPLTNPAQWLQDVVWINCVLGFLS